MREIGEMSQMSEVIKMSQVSEITKMIKVTASSKMTDVGQSNKTSKIIEIINSSIFLFLSFAKILATHLHHLPRGAGRWPLAKKILLHSCQD